MKCILKKEEIIQKEKRTEPVSKWLCLGINDNVNDFDVGLVIDKLVLLKWGKQKENLWWAARTEIVVNTSANELNDHLARINTQSKMHCLESVQIRSFFWSVFGHLSRNDEYLHSSFQVCSRSNFWSRNEGGNSPCVIFQQLPSFTAWMSETIYCYTSRAMNIWRILEKFLI